MSHEPKFGLSLPQMLAGALAAASAAVASSWLGVAGTVIGAAVVSVIASVASALYARPIERGSDKLKAAMPPVRLAPVVVGPSSAPVSPLRRELPGDAPADGPETIHFPVAGGEGASVSPAPVSSGSPVRRVQWRTVAASSVAMLVVGLGLLTGAELLSGKSLSMSGAGRDGSPSLVRVIRGDDQPADSTRTENPDGGPVTGEPGPSQQPSEPDTTEPAESGSTESEPTEPQPTETDPTEEGLTEGEPTDAEPSESSKSEAGPTDFGETEAEPTESTPTDEASSDAQPSSTGRPTAAP